MTLRVAQIGAMTYYEMRMLWRQRLLVVFTLSLIVLTGILLFVLRESAGRIPAAALLANGALEQKANTVQWISMFWPLLYVQIMLLGGLAVVDVMLRDRHWNVLPVLDSTPLRRSVYLLGKLCGAWLAIGLSLAVIMLVAGLLAWWAIGPYELGPYVQLYFSGALPLAGLHVGLCVLLVAWVPARRLAITIVLLFSLACAMLGTVNFRVVDITAWGLLNPGRPYVYQYFWLGWVDAGHRTSLGEGVIWLSVSVGLIELLACGVIVWLWLRMREGRE
jgi:ABC-type transport system involved in multi-copper enzyme maturation permease subunit